MSGKQGANYSPLFLVCKPNGMVNPEQKSSSKHRELNTDGQREGRGMRGEEGKNRTQDPHIVRDGRVVPSQKAEEKQAQELRGFPPQLQGNTDCEQEGC